MEKKTRHASLFKTRICIRDETKLGRSIDDPPKSNTKAAGNDRSSLNWHFALEKHIHMVL